MKKIFNTLLISFLLFNLFCCQKSARSENKAQEFLGEGEYSDEYWPTTEWRTCQPEQVGMNSGKLTRVYRYAANPNINTEGIVIIRKGYIVGEAYFEDFTIHSKHESYSVAKSFSSALIGIAIEKGLINGVNEKIYKFYPEWQKPGTPEAKKKMTIEHLLTMTSGIEWNEEDYYEDKSQNDVFKMIKSSDDYTQYVLNKPIIHEPGEHWYYSSGDSMLLSGIIEKSTKMSAYKFAQRCLFEPLGLSKIIWLSDPSGHTITAWGI